ncbi:MAG: hypothetical protein IJ438_00740 [Clostridia bacterium]|nr:hypothetical protein [Clostridia bacterium]
MANKKKHVNYGTAAARRRNQEKAKAAEQAAKEREFWKAHGKQIAIGAVCVIVAILIIWLGLKWFRGPGGSIPNWFGTLRNTEENWIIKNTGSSSSPKYFHLADFDAPEGYTPENFSYTTDDLEQDQYYVTNDETATVESLYVTGIANNDAASMAANLVMYATMYDTQTEAKQTTIGDYDVHYAYVVYDQTETAETTETTETADAADTTEDTETSETGDAAEETAEVAETETIAYSSLSMYIDAPADSSVLVLLNSHVVPTAEVPTEEQLLAEAEAILANLTIAE